MADLTPLPTAQRPTDGAYQPVSGYAVAAAATAGVFVLFLVLVLFSAITSRRAAMSYELILLPVVGLGLSIAARSHLKRSEGTRSGQKLVTVAWWVCVLGGAGYAAYLYANEFFIERESRTYVDKFFEQLQKNRPHQAYVFLIDPVQRDAASPDNPDFFEAQFASGYGNFRNLDLVRLVRRNPNQVEFEHVGSMDIGQEAEGFKATQIYRMTTPEGIFDVRLGLKAAEARKGGKPLWRINSKPNVAISTKPDKLSQYGRLVQDLEGEANGVVRTWMFFASTGRMFRAHLYTLPGEERESLEKGLNQLAFMGGSLATQWTLTPGFLPEDRRKAREAAINGGIAVAGGSVSMSLAGWTAFDDLLDSGFFRRDDANTPFTPEMILKLRAYWRNPQLGLVNPDRPLPPNVLPSEAARFIFEKDELKVVVPVYWSTMDMKSFYKCDVTLSCVDPEVIRILSEARQKGVSALDNSDLTLRNLPSRRWKITSLQTDLEVILPPQGPAPPR
ncbi:hypothetical protein [Zavarzinella formosa]|uniref:hypothetical protein n=1 Tax=Zavarzinella formosa TaxID=360055 RepID=UPI0003129585|nr:hypothetical protein [Zavarzinella formosa]